MSACGGEVELGDGKLGPLGRDSVNGSGLSDVASTVSAHSGIKPVGYVNGAVRAHRDVAWAEQCDVTDLAAGVAKIGPGKIFLRVAGNENIALGQGDSRALGFRMVAKQGIAGGFATDDVSPEPVFHDPVLVKGDSGWRTASVDVPGRDRSRVFLSPLAYWCGLAGHDVGPPVALPVARGEPHVSVFHQPSRPAGRRIIVVVLKDVPERTDRLLV